MQCRFKTTCEILRYYSAKDEGESSFNTVFKPSELKRFIFICHLYKSHYWHVCTGQGIWSRTWVGLTLFLAVPLVVSQILLEQMRIRQYWHISRAMWWNAQDHCQPNPGPQPDAPSCISLSRAPSTCKVHRAHSPVSCSSLGCLRLETVQNISQIYRIPLMLMGPESREVPQL